jgi:transposase
VDTIVEQSGIEEAAGSGRTRQRRSAEEKLRIVLETLKPGVSVPVVARRHCVNANQLFMWRSQYRRGELVARAEGERPATLVPVQIQPSAPEDVPPQGRCESSPDSAGCMEIQFSSGQRVKVWGQVQAEALRVLIRELLRPC